jgi:hypothetical protein
MGPKYPDRRIGQPIVGYTSYDERTINYGRSVPSIMDLISIKPSAAGLSSKEEEEVLAAWNAFEGTCSSASYDIVAAELNVLPDKRLMRASKHKDPGFNTFLFFYTAFQESLRSCFSAALRDLQDQSESKDWIVWHKDLYDSSNRLLIFDLSALDSPSLQPNPGVTMVPAIAGKPLVDVKRITFKEWSSFKDKHLEPEVPLPTQVQRFVKLLVEKSQKVAGLTQLLKSCQLLIVPFTRPGQIEPETVLDTAAGVLLLLVKQRPRTDDSKPALPALTLGRRLIELITRALLKESFYSIDAENERTQIYGSMAHGTVTAIRAIKSGDLGDVLFRSGNPLPGDDLLVTFNPELAEEERIRRQQKLVEVVQNAVISEDAAVALISLAEMNLNSEVIEWKFLNREDCSLMQLIKDAHSMTKRRVKEGAIVRHLNLQLPDPCSVAAWRVPAGYLSPNILRGILGEFMKNALVHGNANGDGVVDVSVRAVTISDGVIVSFANSCKSGTENKWSGFLERTRNALNNMVGQNLSLSFGEGEENVFEVGLRLGRLKVSHHGGEKFVSVTKGPKEYAS